MSAPPPTERNARTGLFTPPTSTCSARLKISAERALLLLGEVCGVLIEGLLVALRLQPFRKVFGVVSQNNIGPCALNTGQDFEDRPFFVQPTLLRRCFYHGIFPAHVVCADGNIESFAHGSNNVKIRQRRL